MDAWQGELLGFLQLYGLDVLGLILFLESVGAPLPGESLLIAAGALAGEGEFNPWAVGAVAVLAAVLGDNLSYLIGRRAGRPLILKHGRRLGITPERFAKVEALLQRRGWMIVAGARFVVLLRQLNGLVAGAAGMPWRRFLLADIAGAVVWVGLWTTLAYELGAELHIATFLAEHLSWAICLAVGGLLLGGLTVWLVTRHRQPKNT
jgi:membrane protein DedA with SNARE-associated domain